MQRRKNAAMSRSSTTRPAIITAVVAVAAGIGVAGLLLWATGRDGTPKTYAPFNAGYEATVRKNLEKGGPVYFADPFGGDQGFWFALENGSIVAIAVQQPDEPNCAVRWRGSRNTFTGCNDEPRTIESLARYDVNVRDESGQPSVFVDLRTLLPPTSSVVPSR
ncbi:MAG: hypothetical protein ACOYN3_00010 [Acidimicrobiia bacterium]